MFSFLKRASITEGRSESIPPPSSPANIDQSGNHSSFSFMSHSTPQPEGHGENSGFSFIQQPEAEASAGHSSFSFMAEANNQPASSFSFMSPEPAQPQPQTEPQSSFSFMAEQTPPPQSSFSFMAESPAPRHDNITSPDLLSANDSQDLKLNKTAAAKAVKKKKKVARVGTGRDDGNDEDSTVHRRGSANELEIPDPYSLGVSGPQQGFPLELSNLSQPSISYDTQLPPSNAHYVETVHWNVNENAAAPPIDVEETVAAAPVANLPPPPPMYRPETPPNEVPVDNAFVHPAQSLIDTTVSTEEDSSAHHPTNSTSSFVNDFYAGMQQTTSSSPVVESPQQSIADVMTSNPPVQYVTADHRRFDFLKGEQSPAGHTSSAESGDASSSSTSSDNSMMASFTVPSNFNTDLQLVNEKILSCITNLRINYETAYRSQEYLLEEYHQNQKQSLTFIERISLLESKQETLAKQEEFEQAELLTNEINELQKELSNKTYTKQLFLNKIQKLQSDYSRSKVLLIDDISRFLTTLSIHCAETSQKVDKLLNQLQNHQEEEESRISVEEQRVTLEQRQHQREEESLQQESRIIEDAIATQVGDLYEKKSTVSEQLSTVQEEIRILEEQLALKRTHEQELSKTLKSVEFKITDIRKKYDRQLVRINERKEVLQKVTNECEQEMASINQTKKELNEQVEQSETLIHDTEDFIALKMKEKSILATVVQDLQSQEVTSDMMNLSSLGLESSWEVYVLVQTTDTIGKSANMTSTIQQQIDQMTTDYAKSKGHVNDLRIQYDFYYQKVHSLNEEIEKLELQKKLYASNKKFKEAATTAKELKDAMERKEDMNNELQSVKKTLHQEENAHEELEKQVQQLKKVFEEQQKQEKLIHIHRIHQRIQGIRKIIQQLSLKKYLTRKLRRALRNGEVIDTTDWNATLSTTMKGLYEEELQKLVLVREDLCQACETEVLMDDDLLEISDADSEAEEEVQSMTSKQNEESAAVSFVVPPSHEEDLLGSMHYEAEEEEDLPPVVTSMPPPPPYSSSFLDFEIPAPIVDSADHDDIYEQGNAEQEEEVVVPAEVVAEEPKVSAEELQAKIAALEAEMETAAESEDYDKAASIMDDITALKDQLESLSA